MTAEPDAGSARTARLWHLAFYAMMLLSGLGLATAGLPARTLGVALGLLAVLVAAYIVLGRPAAVSHEPRRGAAYLTVLIAVTVIEVWVDRVATTLLFIAFSQIWFFSGRRRTGVALTTVLAVGVWGAFLLRPGADRAEMLGLSAQLALYLFFAILLGLWISQVVDQSQERAVLVRRLETAQAELAVEHHAAGVTAERERLAQEIHDTLAQGFTSIVMLAQTTAADLDRSQTDPAREHLTLIEQTARENLAEARALVAAFTPVALQGSTLGEALGRLAERFRSESGAVVDLRIEAGCPNWDRNTEVVLLRAAQEALANVRRHAHATHVEVRLNAVGERAELEVVDDGSGITPGTPEGIGLRGMRERVNAGGGELGLSALPHGGTRLRISLPAAAGVQAP